MQILEFSFRSFARSLAILGHNLKSHQTHLRPYGVKTETSMAPTHMPRIHANVPISSADLPRFLQGTLFSFFTKEKKERKEDIRY